MLLHLLFCATAHGAIADNIRVRPWGKNALRVQVAPSSWTLTGDLFQRLYNTILTLVDRVDFPSR